MELQITVLLCFLQFRLHFGCDSVKHYPNKRLLATATTVLKTTNVTSEEQCVMSCYYENSGCLVANVITTGDVVTCEMTTGLSNKTDMVDDLTSVLYVANYNKCTEDTGFCHNGGTCQPSWTSARCHCPDLYGSDRCKMCANKRFMGDECDKCASDHYGDKCGYIFTRSDEQDCLPYDDLHRMTSSAGSDYEICKQWCDNNRTCGGFTGKDDNCEFKGFACKDNVFGEFTTQIYFKKMV